MTRQSPTPGSWYAVKTEEDGNSLAGQDYNKAVWTVSADPQAPKVLYLSPSAPRAPWYGKGYVPGALAARYDGQRFARHQSKEMEEAEWEHEAEPLTSWLQIIARLSLISALLALAGAIWLGGLL